MILFNEFYRGYFFTESRQFPVSVRNTNYKRLENRLMRDNRFRIAAAELWQEFNIDPVRAGLELVQVLNNPHGRWYKLPLKIAKSPTEYRLMGFEPKSCPGLMIWDWIGSHEDYNNIWRKKATSLPGEWYVHGQSHEPVNVPAWLDAACKAAKNAKEKNLTRGQAELDKMVRVAAQSDKKKDLARLGRLRRLMTKNTKI